MDADDDEFIPDIDYNDVLPLSLQYREEMQILMDEQEAYEMMKKQESLKTSVLASEGVASAVIIASPDHQGMFGGAPVDGDARGDPASAGGETGRCTGASWEFSSGTSSGFQATVF